MSWIFGLRKEQPPPEIPQFPVPPSSGGEGGGTGDKDDKKVSQSVFGKMDAYRFDSSALERAAKAAKDLETSKFAKEALELTKNQEITRQQEYQVKIKEYEAAMEQAKMDQKRVEGEERRKLLQEETKQHQMRAQYQDQLSRKRYEEQLVQQQRMNEENLRRQEDSVAKQEAMKKATVEHEMQLRHNHDLKKIHEEASAKGKMERENLDVHLEHLRVKGKENRETILQSINTIGSVFGTGINAFLSDWSKVVTGVAAVSALALGVYTSKRVTGVAARYIEARIGKPKLIQETSRILPLEAVKHPVTTIQKRWFPKGTVRDVFLTPTLEERLLTIVGSTRNTKKNRGNYRNIMLYGPPGTGKTMFAKRLANACGMDYAIFTGGDVAQMGREGVKAIHDVFDWSRTSRRGLLLFIDEGDAFFRKRSSEVISEDLRSSINTFLGHTGEQSNKFMLVVATNSPEQFDKALNNRFDELIEFSHPDLETRQRLVVHYFKQEVYEPADKKFSTYRVDNFDPTVVFEKIARITDGLAPREIAKLANTCRSIAFAKDNALLTEQIIMQETERAVFENKQKLAWESKEERDETKFIRYQSIGGS